jgi:metal-responsive CopG/Arc/MetJ family transcriptional regulator
MRRAHVFLPDQMNDTVHAISESRGVSFGEVVRRALEDFIVKTQSAA